MVLVKATADSESGRLPTTEEFAEMGAFNDELVKAGILELADGLKPTSAATRVHFSGRHRIVGHGPFEPAEQQVAGFWIWKVKSLDEAVEWVKRCPNPMRGDSDIEIRPFYEAEDFGTEYTPKLREQEQRQRTQAAAGRPGG
jgi:hypothetical protein